VGEDEGRHPNGLDGRLGGHEGILRHPAVQEIRDTLHQVCVAVLLVELVSNIHRRCELRDVGADIVEVAGQAHRVQEASMRSTVKDGAIDIEAKRCHD
jgi:hypothetical protein